MHLECRRITFRYPGAEAPVFDNMSFRVDEPGFHALFGPSGVGKTSLARMIAGDIGGFDGEITTGDISKKLYSYNLERLPGWSSVGRHIQRITPAGKEERRDELVRIFGIADCMNSRFVQLSLGQRNRVNLLRYLLQDFQMLIMDESLANVDEKTREEIILRVKELYPHVLFLYISHNIVEIARFCRRILVLRTFEKTPQALVIDGQDHRVPHPLDKVALQQSMLEIMNAA